jgi:hypothetical protein
MKLVAQAPRQEDSESLAVVWKHASKVSFGVPLSILVPDARASCRDVIPDARIARDRESRNADHSRTCSGFPIRPSACRE